ncbi:MAG: hypothetical protein KGZ50_09280 [Peptococcaceae bacterium]|nr:hypothetical protein [Peptococcaceae bacterium]
MSKVVKVTISLSSDLAEILDEFAKSWRTSRSSVVQTLIRRQKDIELAQLMAVGYRAMADENLADADTQLAAQAEVALHEQ